MSGITLTIDDRRVLSALTRAPGRLRRELDLAVLRVAMEIGREARRRAPKAFSTLTQSIIHRRAGPLTAEVTAGVDYARYVEEGAGPGGRPPTAAMQAWIRRRGIVSREGLDEEALAFVMARAIARNGTPAQPYMQPALDAKRGRARQLAERAIERVMEGR